jgi:SAM-dependent methyltransferase
VWLFFERRTDCFSGDQDRKTLHIAPEPCFEPRLRKVLGAGYLTADVLADRVDVRMDIANIQFPDGTFDIVYCSHVLEHVPDDKMAMRELQRVLKEGGWAVILVPITTQRTIEDPSITDPKERLRLFGQADHVRRYGPDYAGRLQAAGFTVSRVSPSDFLSPKEIEHMGITGAAGDIYFCQK